MRTMRNLSLFTGSGIGDLAAKQAGIETVAQCENDPACQYALRKLWPECHLFEDVRDVTVDALRRSGCLPIDIISGGFPCTDISTAGKGAGLRGKQSGLWFEMLRVVAEVRPRFVLAENVPALRSRGADTVLAGLEAEGYTCWPVVVGSWAVGAPHKRDRVWIVAHAQSGIQQPNAGGTRNGEGAGEKTSCGGNVRGRLRSSDDGRSSNPSLTELANTAQQRKREPDDTTSPEPQQDAWAGTCGRSRWPSRPGEPQHDWEAPRLVEFGVGSQSDGLARRILERLGSGGNGIPPHKAASRANKSLLKIIGNGWQFDICFLIYRWIMEESIRAYT